METCQVSVVDGGNLDRLLRNHRRARVEPWGNKFLRLIANCEMTLVFAIEDEVGESGEGAGVFGIAAAVEAGFGADGVFESEIAGAVEGSGIADERDQRFRLDGKEFFFV